ncbi:MAG: hypothetical protein ACHQT9_04710, partial [Candidatus Saccharimonadales bacterium]
SISVANFSANKHVYEYLPVNFSVTLHNQGNIYLAPSGDIFISRNSDMSHSIATIPFNSSGANILPSSNRVFKNSWNDGFPVFVPKLVKGNTVYSLSWNFKNANNLRFGKYYAQMAVSYSDGTNIRLITSKISFWVIPWFLILVGTIVCILVAVGLWTLGRIIYKRFQKRSGVYRR